jgi:hypothetical protein
MARAIQDDRGYSESRTTSTVSWDWLGTTVLEILARRPLEGERKIIESAAAKAYRFLDLEFDGDAAGRRAPGGRNSELH